MEAPNRYVQGPGTADRIGEIAGQFGDRFFVFGDEIVLSFLGERVARSLQEAHKISMMETFQGECCYPEIFRLSQKAESHNAQVIVGMGGGKTVDTAKAISIQLRRPVVIVPTIASTDAPASHVVMVYEENHVIKEVLRMKPVPSLIVVDTEVIAQAPVRFLISGMGDALSTRFEAEACWKSGAFNVFGGKPCQASLHLSRLSYEIIREYGQEAIASVCSKKVNSALENVVEANVLLSALGFENCGLAAAHAVETGLSAMEEMRHSLHGERVAYGILIQLVLEKREPTELRDMIGFYKAVGLPIRLKELGLEASSMGRIEKAVDIICRKGSLLYNMPFAIDRDMLIESINVVESFPLN